MTGKMKKLLEIVSRDGTLSAKISEMGKEELEMVAGGGVAYQQTGAGA